MKMFVGNEQMVVQARVLDPPNISYSGDQVKPRDGVWNMQNRRFEKGCLIESFGVVNLAEGMNYLCQVSQSTFICIIGDVNPGAVHKFVDQMLRSAK